MFRFISALSLVSVCCLAAGCADDPVAAPIETPVQITETFNGSLNLNGAGMHTFFTNKGPAELTATLTTLSPDSTAILSFMVGTWNGSYCQVILVKDDATTSANLIGTASAVGSFCVRVADIGRLTAPTDYSITVTHY